MGCPRFLFVALCALALASTTRAAARELPDQAKRGVKLLNDLEDRRAIAAFQAALRDKSLDVPTRARILCYVGLAREDLGDTRGGRAAFVEALELDREAELPREASPKLRAMFARLRTEVRPRHRSPPAAVTEAPPPPPPPIVEPKPAERPAPPPAAKPAPPPAGEKVAAAPTPEAQRAAEKPIAAAEAVEQPAARPGFFSRQWPGVVVLGAAGASLVVGLGAGLAARDAESRMHALESPNCTSCLATEIGRQYDSAEIRARNANIMYGVSGGLALVGGILLWARSSPASGPTFGLAVEPGGAQASLALRF